MKPTVPCCVCVAVVKPRLYSNPITGFNNEDYTQGRNGHERGTFARRVRMPASKRSSLFSFVATVATTLLMASTVNTSHRKTGDFTVSFHYQIILNKSASPTRQKRTKSLKAKN
jgi:hypothetical protein